MQNVQQSIILFKNYVGIKEASEEDNSAGLMAWNGQTLTVRGDIIANSLTLGKNVNISSENISDLKNYVTTSGLDEKLKDYTTTSDMQNEGLAFIVKKNGSIGQFDGTINPDDTKDIQGIVLPSKKNTTKVIFFKLIPSTL